MLTRGLQLGGGFQPSGDGGGGGPQLQVQAGTCIAVTYPVLNTVQISAQIACIQSPWVGNIDGAGYNLNNAGHIGIGAPSTAGYGIVIAAGTNSGILIATNGSTNYGVVHQESSPIARGGFMCINDEGRVAGLIFGGSNYPIPIYQNNVVLVAPLDLLVETNLGGTAGQFIFTRTARLGLGTITPGYALEVAQGDINITDPAFAGYAYRINGIPLATANADGTTINLTNVSNVNGQPYGPAGASGQIQYNNGAGAFGASANLVWDAPVNTLRLNNPGPGGTTITTPAGSTLSFNMGGPVEINTPNSLRVNTIVANVLSVWNTAQLTVGANTPTRIKTVFRGDVVMEPRDDTTPILSFNTPGGTGTVGEFGTVGGINDVWLRVRGYSIPDGGNLRLSAEGSIVLNTGGAERMRITSTGNVGIGTATPTSRLSIVGLPTSAAGLSAGDVWNNGGVLNIV